MKGIKIKAHKRGKTKVKAYIRKKRGKGKKRIVGIKPIKFYPIRDEYGQLHGFSREPGKKKK